MVHELGTMPLFLAGSHEQKQKYLPKLASGEYLIAFGLTEPNAGSDVSGLRTKAVREGTDWVLNGAKVFISHGDAADLIVIAAKTDTTVPGHKGTTLFVAEKGTPGLSIGKHENKLGIRGSSTVEIIIEDVRVPAENVIGQEGGGFPHYHENTRLYPHSGSGAGSRHRTGRTRLRRPIHQRAHPVRQAHLLVSGPSVDDGRHGHPGGSRQTADIQNCGLLRKKCRKIWPGFPKRPSVFSAMAKLFAAETAMKVTTDAVQLLGGYGYVKEYPVERMMRDAKITQIYEGTSQVQKMVIAGTL